MFNWSIFSDYFWLGQVPQRPLCTAANTVTTRALIIMLRSTCCSLWAPHVVQRRWYCDQFEMVWVCGGVGVWQWKPLIRLTWNLPISSALHYAEACWFWVRKVSGASVHISGLSLNPRWRAFMVIHAWHEVWCHPEQLCLHLHQRNRGDCRDVPRSRALRQILTTSGFITDIDWAVDMAQNWPLWSLFSAHCTVHC